MSIEYTVRGTCGHEYRRRYASAAEHADAENTQARYAALPCPRCERRRAEYIADAGTGLGEVSRPPECPVARVSGSDVIVRFPYDPQMVAMVKSLPGRKWDPTGKAWIIPDSPRVRKALTEWGCTWV